jgi:hypothetical protein
VGPGATGFDPPAGEVSALDLLATELVVLLAYKTGLGQVHVGESVLGLRRAFVLAGAKTLVMSLWKVPDDATRELMEDFYRRILAGEGRADALRKAQFGDEGQVPRPVLLGRAHLPGRSFAAADLTPVESQRYIARCQDPSTFRRSVTPGNISMGGPRRRHHGWRR